MSTSHTISFTVKDGNFDYHGNEIIYIDPGDTIEWNCPEGHPFAVHIGRDSPLEKGRFRAQNNEKVTTTIPVKPGSDHLKIVKYMVAVFDGDNIWTDDPLIIIKKPSG